MSNTSESNRSKAELLRQEGTLNPTAEKVLDAKFRDGEFFDPRDLVQVKYEMLRRVSIENAAVAEAVQAFGLSRPTYYHARANLERAGIAGLVPKKRGPRGPHKMHGDALAFVQQKLVSGQPIRARQLARLLRQEFRLTVHPRTIERALRGKKTT